MKKFTYDITESPEIITNIDDIIKKMTIVLDL